MLWDMCMKRQFSLTLSSLLQKCRTRFNRLFHAFSTDKRKRPKLLLDSPLPPRTVRFFICKYLRYHNSTWCKNFIAHLLILNLSSDNSISTMYRLVIYLYFWDATRELSTRQPFLVDVIIDNHTGSYWHQTLLTTGYKITAYERKLVFK